MYLRLGWVLGNVGLPLTLLIVTLATTITFLTGLSLSALATNRRVEGGGAYYIISRSLGVEAGAAVGLPLFFAQALGISFYVAGFSESMVAVFPDLIPRLLNSLSMPQTVVTSLTPFSPRIIGILTLLLLTLIAFRSADLALKTQFVIMALIFVSLLSFLLGGSPQLELAPDAAVPATKPFWLVFAVFFPAVTGIEAGIAMSGDLKDPARSLPRGTIAAILTGYAVYIIIPFFMVFFVTDTRLFLTESMILCRIARWGQVVVLGIWAASLSSAMGALLGAPRTLQALARDGVIPPIFARGFGAGNDPRIATAAAFLVGLAGILVGGLNIIAPVLSMFFLTSYGALNVAAGLEELTGPPSWRPKFRVAWPISLAGAFACFATMFMINAGATFIAASITISVYFVMERRSIRARWGDMRSGILMMVARFAINGLATRKPDERTWKPNILVMSGAPTSRWHLIDLASAISQDQSLLTVAAVIPDNTPQEHVDSLSTTLAEYLDKRDVRAVVKIFQAPSALEGAATLVRAYGYGPITPNTILLGQTTRPENYEHFARLVKTVCDRRLNLVIVRERDEPAEPQPASRIDIWWYGTQHNLGLMLALCQLLKRSQAWRDAALTIKNIITDRSKFRETEERLEKFIQRVRVTAEAEVVVETSGDIFSCIRRNSQGADLVFLGMRAPRDDETIPDYCRYYQDLLANTEGLPPTSLILAAEEMDFYAIFSES